MFQAPRGPEYVSPGSANAEALAQLRLSFRNKAGTEATVLESNMKHVHIGVLFGWFA